MKKLTCEIVFLAGILFMICLGVRLAGKNTYTMYVPLHGKDFAGGEIRMEEGREPPVSFGEPVMERDYLRLELQPRRRDEETFRADILDKNGEVIESQWMRVGRWGTIFDTETGGFTGDNLVLGGFASFSLLSALLMLRFFINCRGPRLYTYNALYTAGFSIFLLVTGILLTFLMVQRILSPASFSMFRVYSAVASAGWRFMMVTCPLVLIFALLMAISNIELLRHERRRFANVLGILVSLLLVAGEAFGFWLFSRDFMGSLFEYRVHETLENVYAVVFVYFECMLLGAVICGIRAVRHRPALDKDFILILGCGFRKDGSLTPLLRGRVDRAVDFWRKQREETGKTAFLMPSGGQGPDEVMAEAEAMKRYLLSECRIPEQYILTEDQSKNTYQNMAFSRKLIEEQLPGAKTIFSTTNYHVFRSGVWAGLAGLEAEGIGSRTKWWFWPNAFIRECVGLLRNRIRQELVLLLFLIALFGSISMLMIS